MELIHFHSNVSGIRFFGRAKDVIDKYQFKHYYYTEGLGGFLDKLDSNKEKYDVALVMMHGAKGSFIVPKPVSRRNEIDMECDDDEDESEEESWINQYDPVIELDKAYLFKNDCVIAVSCYTASRFGPKAISEGALAYLGYDSELGKMFRVEVSDINGRLKDFYEMQIRRIYTELVAESVCAFITEFQTIKTMKQTISLRYQQKLNELLSLDADSLRNEYHLNVSKRVLEKDLPSIYVYLMGELNEINAHYKLLGDENYISMLGFDENVTISTDTFSRLSKISFLDKKYEKCFIEKFEQAAGQQVIDNA